MGLKSSVLFGNFKDKEVRRMQMCPECDMVYDESEYSHCPYCSGELDEECLIM